MRYKWVHFDSRFNDEKCEQFIDFCQQFPEKQAGITTDNKLNNSMRSSIIRWLPKDNFVEQELLKLFREANRYFDIEIRDLFEIQFTEYHATTNGHYDWHHDVFFEADNIYDRKLSAIIQLSDPNSYEGGDFQFDENTEKHIPAIKNRGTAVIFPSYFQHRVTSVTKGVRKSLVAWIEGPRWR